MQNTLNSGAQLQKENMVKLHSIFNFTWYIQILQLQYF